MAENKKTKMNPVVAGAVLAGAAAAAVVLSKKENREKAGKILKDLTSKGKKLAKDPEVKKTAIAATDKIIDQVADSAKKKVTEATATTSARKNLK